MNEKQRTVSWIKGALRDCLKFPQAAQDDIALALRVASSGRKAEIAKPMKGFSDGVFEIALKHRGDAYRTVYAVKIDDAIWVLHAFQKKSKTGIKTPKQEVDLITARLRRLKEELK